MLALLYIFLFITLMDKLKLKLRRLPKIPTLAALMALQTAAPPLSDRRWYDSLKMYDHSSTESITEGMASLYIDQQYGRWDFTRRLAESTPMAELSVVPAVTSAIDTALLDAEFQRYSSSLLKELGNTAEYHVELVSVADRINQYIARRSFSAKALANYHIDTYRVGVVDRLASIDESSPEYADLSLRRTIEASPLVEKEAYRMQAVAVAEQYLQAPDQQAEGLISLINVDDSGSMTSTVLALLNLERLPEFASSRTKLGRAILKLVAPGKSSYRSLDTVREFMGPEFEYRVGDNVMGVDPITFLHDLMDRLPELAAKSMSKVLLPIGEVVEQRIINVYSAEREVYLPEWLMDNILEFVELPEILIFRITGNIIPSRPMTLHAPTVLELVEGDKLVTYELKSITGTDLSSKGCFTNIFKNGEWRHVTDLARGVIDPSTLFDQAEIFYYERS